MTSGSVSGDVHLSVSAKKEGGRRDGEREREKGGGEMLYSPSSVSPYRGLLSADTGCLTAS